MRFAPFEWECGEETPDADKMARVFEDYAPSPRVVPAAPAPPTRSVEEDGGPGTGKTYWARDVLECMKDAAKSVKVIASTHAAALNAAGDGSATFHRYFCLGGGGVSSLFPRRSSAPDLIWADEHSMMTEQMWQALHDL